MKNNLAILYSFRRCPYAIRARLALSQAQINLELREVVLANKPTELLAISPKATVPVLQTTEGKVIDESLDIMYWALQQQDNADWLNKVDKSLIALNDGEFKYYLDRYKYADRYPQNSELYYRQQAELFLQELEQRLQQHSYLSGEKLSFTDAAIFPFIRQFVAVDRAWFDNSAYHATRHWLDQQLDSPLFKIIMVKYPPWQAKTSLQLLNLC